MTKALLTKPAGKGKYFVKGKHPAKAKDYWPPKAERDVKSLARILEEAQATLEATKALKSTAEKTVARLHSHAVLMALLAERKVEQKVGREVAKILQQESVPNLELVAMFQGKSDDLLPL